MAVRNIPNEISMDLWREYSNLLAEDFGDLATFDPAEIAPVAPPYSDVVKIVRWINYKVNSGLVSNNFTLPIGLGFYGTKQNATVQRLFYFDPADNTTTFDATTKGITITDGHINSLVSPLAIADGGTASSSAPDARTALGLAIGTNVQAYNINLADISAINHAGVAANSCVVFSSGAWTALAPADARTALGLSIGYTQGGTQYSGNVQAWDSDLETISNLTPTDISVMMGRNTGLGPRWSVQTPAQTKSLLGLTAGVDIQAYNASLQDIANIPRIPGISGSSLFYITDTWVALPPGSARDAMGLEIGSDVQAYNINLADIAGINHGAVAAGSAIILTVLNDVPTWTAKSPADTRTALGLAVGTNVQAHNINLADISAINHGAVTQGSAVVFDSGSWIAKSPSDTRTALGLAIGTNVQAYNANLADISALSPASNYFLVGNGSHWTTQSPSSVVSTLGLVIGTNTQAHSAILDKFAALANPTQNYFVAGSDSGGYWYITPANVRSVISAAASGANSDITSLSAITTLSYNMTVSADVGCGTVTAQWAYYQKSGDFCTVMGGLYGTFQNSSPRAVIYASLPFNAYNNASSYAFAARILGGGVRRPLDASVAAGSNQITFVNFEQANFTATSGTWYLEFEGTYRVA